MQHWFSDDKPSFSLTSCSYLLILHVRVGWKWMNYWLSFYRDIIRFRSRYQQPLVVTHSVKPGPKHRIKHSSRLTASYFAQLHTKLLLLYCDEVSKFYKIQMKTCWDFTEPWHKYISVIASAWLGWCWLKHISPLLSLYLLCSPLTRPDLPPAGQNGTWLSEEFKC